MLGFLLNGFDMMGLTLVLACVHFFMLNLFVDDFNTVDFFAISFFSERVT